MSIRVLVCGLLVVYFSLYAWRNYFVSLCAAVVLMAFMQHPDVIDNLKNIGGIQGLNPFNILIANVFLAWLAKRRAQGFIWDMPRRTQNLLIGYFIVVSVSVFRLLIDPAPGWQESKAWMISEYFVNCVKWVLPCLIAYDVCRTRRRVVIMLICIMSLYLLLALQVIKHMPLSYAMADNFEHTAYKMVQESVGYNRVTLSMMLGGASWAMIAILPMAATKWRKMAVLAGAAAISFGQALTGGRSGYAGWLVVGIILCLARWRRMLLVIPVVVVAIGALLPGVRERAFQGIAWGSDNPTAQNSAYEMTSGRNIAWPYVIAKIKDGPIFGFGREAMTRTGIYQQILIDTGNDEVFPHPHNAYLEILLDCGLVGFLVVVPFYVGTLRSCFRLFLSRDDPFREAVGGVACALILALLVAAMGGETFYPREGSVGMWASIGIALRVWADWRNGAGTSLQQQETEGRSTEELLQEEEPVANTLGMRTVAA